MRIRGRNDRLKLGEWNVTCDLTGFKMKSSQVVRRWDGMIVRRGSSEERHPQDFLRSVPERTSVAFSRPAPAMVFIEPYPAALPFDPRTLDPNFVPIAGPDTVTFNGETVTFNGETVTCTNP